MCTSGVDPAPFSNSGVAGSGNDPHCGDLRPWLSLTGTSLEHAVIDGADGLAGYTKDAIGVFDGSGAFTPRMPVTGYFPRGVTIPVPTLGGGVTYDTQKTWMVKAVSRGSTFALLTQCQYSLGYCGSSLLFGDRASFSVDDLFEARPINPIDIYTGFRTYAPGFTLAANGSAIVAANVFELSDTRTWISTLRIKKLNVANVVQTDSVIPLSAATSVIQIADLRLDELGRVLILYSVRKTAADGTSALAPGSRLLILDTNLKLVDSYTAPADVTVRAFALAPDGRAVLAGNVEGTGGAQAWLTTIDLNTLENVWSSPALLGAGMASAVTIAANGDVLVAGSGATERTAWLARYTSDGAPVWPYRSELNATGYFQITESSAQGRFKITGVAEQSDRSVFVASTATSGFQAGSPLTFPADTAPPATCSATGSCDCAPRGWEGTPPPP